MYSTGVIFPHFNEYPVQVVPRPALCTLFCGVFPVTHLNQNLKKQTVNVNTFSSFCSCSVCSKKKGYLWQFPFWSFDFYPSGFTKQFRFRDYSYNVICILFSRYETIILFICPPVLNIKILPALLGLIMSQTITFTDTRLKVRPYLKELNTTSVPSSFGFDENKNT